MRASLANWSQRSFSGCPEWPRVHFHSTLCVLQRLCRSSHRALFLTGLPLAVRHPFLTQLLIHAVMPLIIYSESVVNSTSQGSLRYLRATIAAVISMILLVVSATLPLSSTLSPFSLIMHPYPPGPGLPLQQPSVNILTFLIHLCVRVWVID